MSSGDRLRWRAQKFGVGRLAQGSVGLHRYPAVLAITAPLRRLYWLALAIIKLPRTRIFWQIEGLSDFDCICDRTRPLCGIDDIRAGGQIDWPRDSSQRE